MSKGGSGGGGSAVQRIKRNTDESFMLLCQKQEILNNV